MAMEVSSFEEAVLSSANANEVPEAYVWKGSSSSEFGPIDLSVPLATHVPVIDFAQLRSPAELQNLRSALSSWGCFQAINHGIDISLLENLRQFSKEFFHRPMTEKQKYGRTENSHEGYGNDLVLVANQSLDWTDRLYLTVSPQADQNHQYWPKDPEYFRDMLNDYTNQVTKLLDELLQAMARSLGLPEDRFVKQYGESPTIFARFNFYPTCARPDLALGLKPHSDGSLATFLLQDKDLPGLQVLKDDQWFLVPVMPHALLVNVGDQIEVMSNGILKSPVHRALTNSKQERSTLAMFCCPDPTVEIRPLEELIDESRPKAFKSTSNYVGSTYFHYFQMGKRPIDVLRI